MECNSQKLLSLVEKRPAIYNSTLKEYSSGSCIAKLWEEIASEMECDVIDCKHKWTTLRNSYTRAIRNEISEKTNSTGKPVKKWYLQDRMSFMRDFVQNRGSTKRSIPFSENSFHSSNDLNEFEDTKDDIFQHSPLTLPKTETLSESSSETEIPAYKRQKLLTSVERVVSPMVECNNESHVVENENPNMVFFRSLLLDLDKLAPKNQRAFKSYTFQKLMELLDEQEESESAGMSQYL